MMTNKPDRIDALYRGLTGAFPHPFDWMALLDRPPFWWWRQRRAHPETVAIFAAHGFTLTPQVANEYHRIFPEDCAYYGEDAGGKITRKLRRALEGSQ